MRNHFHLIYLLIVLLVLGFVVYNIFSPFLVAIFLAYIFSQLFKSWYEAFNRLLKGKRSIASLLSCLIILLIFIIPLVIISLVIVSEANEAYQKIQHSNWTANVEQFANHPALKKFGISQELISQEGNLSSSAKNISDFILGALSKTYQSATNFVFMTVVMFFTLYYFFKDGDEIMRKILQLSPFKNSQEKILLSRFNAASKATLKGSLVIAIVQGALTGVLLWITGVGSPVFLGLLAGFFALIPMLGTGIIWFPAGLIMLALGNIWQGVIILLAGVVVINTIDNFLRPALVGNQASLHPLLVFFSTLGGVAYFGLTGVLLGPVIAVLFITLLDMYQKEYKKEMSTFKKA